MGEAKRRELATTQATGGPATMKLGMLDAVVCLQLDLACSMLAGFAQQLGTSYERPDVAAEFGKSIEHLQGFKVRYLAALRSKLIIAQPGDVPPMPVLK